MPGRPLAPIAFGGTPMLALPAPPFTVLVVDDNADCVDSLGLLVRLRGHYATVAYDGASALVLAERLHPDVALLDLGMRDMGGCELGRQLRSMPGLSRLTLVAVTGYADDGHRSEALAAGFAF